jgi:uncharacterized protein (TIGR02001 family)
MKTKINLLLASLVGWATTGAIAQTAAPAPATAPAVSFTATAAVVSEYMFRGQRLNGAGFQPAIEMAAGNLTAGIWTNFVLDNKVADSSDPEIDVYGSYTFTLGKDLTLVPGATAYFYPSAPTSAGFYRTTFEPSLALNYTVEGVKLTPKVYYDMTLEGATYEFTAAYAIPLKDIGSELGFTATLGTYLYKEFANHTSPSVKAWGDYWLVGVSMPFQLDKNSKLSLGFAYTEGRDAFTKQGSAARSPNGLALGRGVVTVSYALSF